MNSKHITLSQLKTQTINRYCSFSRKLNFEVSIGLFLYNWLKPTWPRCSLYFYWHNTIVLLELSFTFISSLRSRPGIQLFFSSLLGGAKDALRLLVSINYCIPLHFFRSQAPFLVPLHSTFYDGHQCWEQITKKLSR